uniref:SHR-BD domain-containing protein n=1 Tax=Elaeophora elaphi TaxID=1147741 RepID=A0A158Q8V6_9BILA
MAPRVQRFRLIIPAIEPEEKNIGYSWSIYLGKTITTITTSSDAAIGRPQSVVPVESFREAVFIDYMKHINKNIKVDITLHQEYGQRFESLKLYWFARVVKIAGYRLLLRFEGIEEQNDHGCDFWINLTSQDIRPLESLYEICYCANDIESRALVPPSVIHEHQLDWRRHKRDEVELLDSLYRLRVRPARIENVIGSRIWVSINKEFQLRPTISKGDSQGSLDNPIAFRTKAEGDEITWKKGMKLEVLDPFGNWNELRVFTVTGIMDDGHLKITFDGEMGHYSLPLHLTSDSLFPIDYAAKYGVLLKIPKDIENPGNGVIEISTVDIKFAKVGAKLEAADMFESHLICPAAVLSHHGRLMRVSYEGWSNKSPNIFPLGWCEMHGYVPSPPGRVGRR